jgi:hypothetical protein
VMYLRVILCCSISSLAETVGFLCLPRPVALEPQLLHNKAPSSTPQLKMSPSLNLVDSAISLDMSPPPSSTQSLTDRLSNLSALLQKTPHLSTEQSNLISYHLSALETVLSPSSLPTEPEIPISPPPSGGFQPSSVTLQPSLTTTEKTAPISPSSQLISPTNLLTTLTTITASLRARQAESQNLHSLFLLKLSALAKRILELEERVRELYVLLFGFLEVV